MHSGGESNTNDIMIWGFDTAGDATTAGTGQMFGFQFPRFYQDDGEGLEVLLLGDARTWQSSQPPVLTVRVIQGIIVNLPLP